MLRFRAEHTGSSRETAYNHELRRGQRAPDARAAALAKRAFVRATPYLVTTAALPWPAGQPKMPSALPFVPLFSFTQRSQPKLADVPSAAAAEQNGEQVAATSAGAMSSERAHSQQGGEESAEAKSSKRSLRLEGKRATGKLPSYKRGAAELCNGELKQASAAAHKRRKAGAPAEQPTPGSVHQNRRIGCKHSKQSGACAAFQHLPRVCCHDDHRPSAHFTAACGAGAACNGTAEHEEKATAQQAVRSLAERYADMKRTVMQRLTCGALHQSEHASCACPCQDRMHT